MPPASYLTLTVFTIKHKPNHYRDMLTVGRKKIPREKKLERFKKEEKTGREEDRKKVTPQTPLHS